MGKVGGDSFQLQKQWSLSEIVCFRPSWLVSTFKRSSLNDFLFQKYLEVLPTPHSLIDWINILMTKTCCFLVFCQPQSHS